MHGKTSTLSNSTPIRTEPLPLEFPGLHHIGREELDAVARVLESRSLWRYNGLTVPREVESFESEFAAFVGAKHAVAVTSGSNALATALAALGVGPGQEVIIPAYMWVSVPAASIPLGSTGWIVADRDGQAESAEGVLNRFLPGAATRAVASSAVRQDEEFAGRGVSLASLLLPPLSDGIDGKGRRIVTRAHEHSAPVGLVS
jgi:hypothetical protein